MLTAFAMLTTALFAFAFGRRIVLWTLFAYWFAFWPLVVLFLLSKKPVKLPRFPQFALDWYGKRFVTKTIAKMEAQF